MAWVEDPYDYGNGAILQSDKWKDFKADIDEFGNNIANKSVINDLELGKISTTATSNLISDIIYEHRWSFASLYKLNALSNETAKINLVDNKALDALVSNITINPIQTQPIQEYIGGKWVYTNGVEELKQIDITFRDTIGLGLYTSFKLAFKRLKDEYPDKQKWKIQVHGLENNWGASPRNDEKASYVLSTRNALLTNIGALSFDSSSKEVITFTVTFMYSEG